ncbi:MAG: hypothetical protein WA045_14230 [Nitrospira sp.]
MQMLILTHEESDAEHYNSALHTLEAWDIAQRMKIEQQAKEIGLLQQALTKNRRELWHCNDQLKRKGATEGYSVTEALQEADALLKEG